jgi:hypothetical protein
MRKIIYTLNAAVSGLITVIAILTDFYEVRGVKLLLIATMGFAVMSFLLLEIEKAVLRRGRHEEAGERKNSKVSVPNIPWFKMRFRPAVKNDRDSQNYTSQIQRRTGYYSAESSAAYR